MTNVTGTCSSKVQSQSNVAIKRGPDDDNHEVSLAVVIGHHKSPDELWNDTIMTYVATSDTIGGNGKQTGYFHNVHRNGDTSYGAFEADVKTSGQTTTIDGHFHFRGGTGGSANVKGGGTYSAQMTSPTTSEMTWSGSYEL